MSEITAPAHSPSGKNDLLLDLRDVKKVYRMGESQVRALDGITLTVHRNEYIAIMGSSGSGKSTLMNIIGCLDTPSAGLYYLRGANVGEMADNELARIRNGEIGFVFQTFNLLPRVNCIHNVELPLVYSGIPKSRRRALAREALESVGLGDRMTHKPNELSGGQRQRVAVARALVNKPSILLADEPTGNLDSRTSEELMHLFERLHRDGNTVIIVTHEPDIAQYARRVVHLHDGKIDEDRVVDSPTLEGAEALSV
jgi:putative ABC transport system ATP-binding protein